MKEATKLNREAHTMFGTRTDEEGKRGQNASVMFVKQIPLKVTETLWLSGTSCGSPSSSDTRKE